MAGRVLAEPAPHAARIDWPAALKETGLAAFVALILFLPLVGMQTVKIEGGLGLNFRFGWVLTGVALVAAGRLLLVGLRSLRPETVAAVTTPIARIPALLAPLATFAIAAGIVFALVLPFLPFANRYVVDVATTVLIYVMLGWGLNIVVGLAGLLDLGYVAFYAVGAYSYALFARWFDLGFWECLPLAGVLAASFGILLGFPVLRLRGDYLAIVTLGFGEIVRIILLNWYPVTRGPDGLSGIPRPSFFGLEFDRSPPEGATAFHEVFGLEYSGYHRVAFLYFLALALAPSASCRSAAPGRRCARTRSPAARSASTRPTPSSPPSRSARCSAASRAPSSPPARASSAPRASPSSSRRRSSRSSCWAAWAARSAWCWRRRC
ncbi:MAG: transporter permease [Geminicoccaceae bacterium]|nr:transporter permease [Geminicoccaceae bacterium]